MVSCVLGPRVELRLSLCFEFLSEAPSPGARDDELRFKIEELFRISLKDLWRSLEAFLNLPFFLSSLESLMKIYGTFRNPLEGALDRAKMCKKILPSA